MREIQTGSEPTVVRNVFSYVESIRKKLVGLAGSWFELGGELPEPPPVRSLLDRFLSGVRLGTRAPFL